MHYSNAISLPSMTMTAPPDPSSDPPLSYALSQLTYLEQVRLIMTHPFFTGQCPDCKVKLHITERVMGRCQCSNCGWSDQARN
jgi:hypothetical protein